MLAYFNYYLSKFVKDEKGQGMVEYALIIALIAVLLIGALTFLKDDIAAIFDKIGEAMNPTV